MEKNKKFISFIKDKGFYIALALCIVGASAAAWVNAGQTINGIKENNKSIAGSPSSSRQEVSSSWPSSQQISEKPVSQSAQDVIKPSSSSISQPSSSSSRPASSASSAPSSSSASSAPQQEPRILSYVSPLSQTEIINPFSDGKLVKNHTLNVWRTHDAVDLKAAKGQEVYAVSDGTVDSVRIDPLWGGVISIKHPDTTVSVYTGVAAAKDLKAGDKVTGGQTIGTIDQITAEISMEPHLHFAVMKDKKYVDPSQIIDFK